MAERSARRAEFDWLRIVAIGLMMLFHSCLGFSSWPWHVNDPHRSVLLGDFLSFLWRWRVALVFVVSGAALMLALEGKPINAHIDEALLPEIVETTGTTLITKDNAGVLVDAVIYFQITDRHNCRRLGCVRNYKKISLTISLEDKFTRSGNFQSYI